MIYQGESKLSTLFYCLNLRMAELLQFFSMVFFDMNFDMKKAAMKQLFRVCMRIKEIIIGGNPGGAASSGPCRVMSSLTVMTIAQRKHKVNGSHGNVMKRNNFLKLFRRLTALICFGTRQANPV